METLAVITLALVGLIVIIKIGIEVIHYMENREARLNK